MKKYLLTLAGACLLGLTAQAAETKLTFNRTGTDLTSLTIKENGLSAQTLSLTSLTKTTYGESPVTADAVLMHKGRLESQDAGKTLFSPDVPVQIDDSDTTRTPGSWTATFTYNGSVSLNVTQITLNVVTFSSAGNNRGTERKGTFCVQVGNGEMVSLKNHAFAGHGNDTFSSDPESHTISLSAGGSLTTGSTITITATRKDADLEGDVYFGLRYIKLTYTTDAIASARTVSGKEGTWSSDTSAWTPSAPATYGNVELTASGDATLTIKETDSLCLTSLKIQPDTDTANNPDTLTLAGEGDMFVDQLSISENVGLAVDSSHFNAASTTNMGILRDNNTAGRTTLIAGGTTSYRKLTDLNSGLESANKIIVKEGDEVSFSSSAEKVPVRLQIEGGSVTFNRKGADASKQHYGDANNFEYTQIGGTVTVNAENKGTSDTYGFLLGYTTPSGTLQPKFTVSGGTLNITKSFINFYQASTTLTIGGGDTAATVYARGLSANSGSKHTLMINSNGALHIGWLGFAKKDALTSVLNGGTLSTFESDPPPQGEESKRRPAVQADFEVRSDSYLSADPNEPLIMTGTLSGSGGLTVNGTGLVDLSKATFSNCVTVDSEATLRVAKGKEAKVNLNSGTLQIVLESTDDPNTYTPAKGFTYRGGSVVYGTVTAGVFTPTGSFESLLLYEKPLVHLTFEDASDLLKNTGSLEVTKTEGTATYAQATDRSDAEGWAHATALKVTNPDASSSKTKTATTLSFNGVMLKNSTVSFWGTRSNRGSTTVQDTFGIEITDGTTKNLINWRRDASYGFSVYTNTTAAITNLRVDGGDTTLHHYVLVTDKTKMTLYVDGSLLTSTVALPGGTTDECRITKIGLGGVANNVDVADCWLDDVRVYDKALTAEEVQQLYTGTSAPQLTWMPFGDSITEGESTAASYRHVLWKLLTAAGYNIQSVGLRNVTKDKNQKRTYQGWSYHNGWRGATVMPIRKQNNDGNGTSLFLNLDTALEAGGYPDIITVMVGTNDASESNQRGGPSMDSISNRFEEWVVFIDRLATLRPNAQIFVATPPKRYSEESNKLIAAYAEKIRGAYQAEPKAEPFKSHKNLHFVDMFEKTSAFGVDDYVEDQLHPNESGCQKIGAVWAEAITNVVGTVGQLKTATDKKGALLPVEVFNTDAQTIQVRFNKPLAETQTATATLADVTLTQETFDARTITFKALSALTTGAEVTVTVKNVQALDGSSIGGAGASFTFTPYGSGALANIPEKYRENFVHRKTLNIKDDNPNYSNGIPYAEDEGDASTISAPGRVAYYMELQRPGKPVQFVWVSMDAFDTTEANLYVPTTGTGMHQCEVTGLEVFANRGNISNTTEKVKGIVEFTPYKYSKDDAGFTTIPDMFEGVFGWHDTLQTSGDLRGCMQVAQIINDASSSSSPLWANAQMLFAFNEFYKNGTESDCYMDIGIGSFATSWTSGAETVDAITYDWTYATKSGIEDVMPSAYEVKKLEIWVEPKTVATWKGTSSVNWDDDENWEENEAPDSTDIEVVLSENAENTLTLQPGSYNTHFTGGGGLAIAAGATVTLQRDNLYTGGTEIGAGATVTIETATSFGTGPVRGTGTVKLMNSDCLQPRVQKSNPPATYFTTGSETDGWRGTVEVDGVTFEPTHSIEMLGNQHSTIVLNGENTGKLSWKPDEYFSAAVCPSAVELNGSLTLSQGHQNQTFTFKGPLSGTGTFENSQTTETNPYTLIFEKVANFEGAFVLNPSSNSNKSGRIRIGSESGTPGEGQILITGTANIATNKTWTTKNGIVVNSGGTLKVAVNNLGAATEPTVGSVSGGLTLNEGSILQVDLKEQPTGKLKVLSTTGTVAPNGTTTVTIPKMDESGATTKTIGGWTSMKGEDGLYLRRQGFMLSVK